jgi:hypothetical protein
MKLYQPYYPTHGKTTSSLYSTELKNFLFVSTDSNQVETLLHKLLLLFVSQKCRIPAKRLQLQTVFVDVSQENPAIAVYVVVGGKNDGKTVASLRSNYAVAIGDS